jgi:hypothetical protein
MSRRSAKGSGGLLPLAERIDPGGAKQQNGVCRHVEGRTGGAAGIGEEAAEIVASPAQRHQADDGKSLKHETYGLHRHRSKYKRRRAADQSL